MPPLDPRITPARPDLAAAHLRGQVQAARFVEGTVQEVVAGIAPIRSAPSHDSALLTEALYGERIKVYEADEEGWVWGQLESDDYVGYAPAAAMLTPRTQPTHKVAVLRTFLFPGPSIKLPPIDALPMGAQVPVVREDESFAITATGHYIPKRHLALLQSRESDFVAVAERFIGTPYLWGGKSSLGIDCSGLVQVALTASGIFCPRDSDMQEAALGDAVSLSSLKRGDLVFWKGHIAMALDGATLVHANAFHMQVATEPLADAVARIRASGSEVTSVRRLGRQ
jgi:cell wall-associated NlpC family hydrolase